MRITNNMMISNMNRNLQTNIKRLETTQLQYSTGKRIHKPSDDPIAITRVLKTKSTISNLAQYKKNVDDSISWLENTEETVASYSEGLKRLRDLMVQGANGTLSQEATGNIQNEVAEIKSQIIALSNSTYSGDYIFSGKNTDTKLMDSTGVYQVNVAQFLNSDIVDHRINYEMGIGETLAVNTVGTSLFEAAGLNFDVKLPSADGEEKNYSYLGSKIKLTGISTDITDPDAPLNYDVDITIDGIGTLVITGLTNEEDVYNVVSNMFNNINDVATLTNTTLGAGVTATFTPDPDPKADANLTPTEAWNKTLIKNNIAVDLNNLNFKTYTNNGDVVGVVAQPQKAGIINLVERIEKQLLDANYEEVSNLLGSLDKFMDQALVVRGEIGAKVNRAELTLNRIEDDTINLKALRSKLEDVGQAEAAMRLMNEENVYNASLAVGARIIQPTLLDFLR